MVAKSKVKIFGVSSWPVSVSFNIILNGRLKITNIKVLLCVGKVKEDKGKDRICFFSCFACKIREKSLKRCIIAVSKSKHY